jgi:eukaryotic-like serine/threonine-protein kinase
MGAVYRARDTKLGRDVALKVLLPDVADNPERLARFRREAQILASLNHPNIGHIYGLEESNDIVALVLELVEGPTLADRIGDGPIPLDDALPIAKQIAEALECAPEQGIVHRDLKPANIKVREDGTVKVLDFGLAKAFELTSGAAAGPSLTNSPTMTSPVLMTGAGMLLGTAAYMAPEQARGRAVDKRADIWAFGVILFEMLAGTPLFAADSVADTISAILSKTPDWSTLPPAVQPLVQAALEPDPRRRLRDIGDAFRLMGNVAPQTAVRSRWGLRGALVTATIVTLVAVVVAVAWWTRRAQEPAASEMRLQIALPAGALPDLGSLSPDGRRLAFAVVDSGGMRRAWVRDLDDFEARPVPGADDLETNPMFWSPDSRWLGFTAHGAIHKADILTGGKPVRVYNGGQVGADWNAEGTLIFGTNPGRGAEGSIFRLSVAGGEPAPITKVDSARGEYAHHHPTFLPDGRHFLYLRSARPVERSGIYVGSIDAAPDQQSTDPLLATSYGPVFFAPSNPDGSGFLFFLQDDAILAQPFNPVTLALSGQPQQVATPAGAFIDRALFWVSRSRTIVYATAAPALMSQLTWVDRQGQVLRTVGAAGVYVVRSPDGTRAAAVRMDTTSSVPKPELWLSDLTRGVQTLFWFRSPVRSAPIWSPDNKKLIFAVADNGPQLYERDIDGIHEGRVVFRGKSGEALGPTSWSPDGRFVLFTRNDTKTGDDIWLLTPHDGAAIPLIQTAASERDAQFSPDGHWIAYAAAESVRGEIYVTAVRSTSPTLVVGGGPWRVSSGGGRAPRWRRDGKEIFYAGPSSMMAAPVSTGSGFAAGTPVAIPGPGALAGAGLAEAGTGALFVDASPDGRELLLARPVGDGSPRAPVNVLINWAPDSRAYPPATVPVR